MSAPLIVPKGDDRSMTRAMYTAMNKIMRWQWWKESMDEKVDKAAMDAFAKGIGYIQVGIKEKQ